MFPFAVCHGSCRVPLFVFSVLLDSLFLPRLCTLRAAQPAPAPPPPAQTQSIERSRMNAGLPPDLRSSASPQKSKAPYQAQLKAHFEEMKSDAATLAELANSLKADLDKANPNELPATLAEKVEQINKLAKRIGKLRNNF